MVDTLFEIKRTIEDFSEGIEFEDPFESKKKSDLKKLRDMGIIQDKIQSRNKNKKKRRK